MFQFENTYNCPLKVSTWIIAELAQAGVEGAVTLALVPRVESDVIDCNESSVSAGLITLRLGNGFKQQLGLRISVSTAGNLNI